MAQGVVVITAAAALVTNVTRTKVQEVVEFAYPFLAPFFHSPLISAQSSALSFSGFLQSSRFCPSLSTRLYHNYTRHPPYILRFSLSCAQRGLPCVPVCPPLRSVWLKVAQNSGALPPHFCIYLLLHSKKTEILEGDRAIHTHVVVRQTA